MTNQSSPKSADSPNIATKLDNWLDQRTGIDSILHESLDEPIPGGAKWAYIFGSGLLFLFVSQVITGVFLALYYVPSADHAHTVVSYIVKEVTSGSFVRSIHGYGSSGIIILLLLHIGQTILYGSYRVTCPRFLQHSSLEFLSCVDGCGWRREPGHGPAPFEGESELLRCAIVQRAVGSLAVVLLTPGCQSTPNIVQRSEPTCVEALVAQPAMEALDVAVLHRAARLDVHQPNLPVFGPADHPARSELRPVVRAHVLWPATFADQALQHPRHATRAETGVGFQRQALSRVRIYDA